MSSPSLAGSQKSKASKASYASKTSKLSKASKASQPNDKTGPHIITGPVIGMVTDSTVRVLIEMSHDATVTCFLTNKDGDQFLSKKEFKAQRPGSFAVTGLSAETYYKISFDTKAPGLTKCGIKTLPENWTTTHKPKIAALSCNRFKETRDIVNPVTDLWKDLYKKASKGEIDYLLHMGDNVYADTDAEKIEKGKLEFKGDDSDCQWLMAMDKMEGVPPSLWADYYEEVVEIFRTIYRTTWNHPPTRFTLANVPNLMILDDHDIRDDWGDREVDSDPTSLDFFVGCCAYEAYNEYQRNLFEDYEPGTIAQDSCRVGQSYHFHVFGEIGFMFTDCRGCKTFHRNFEEPHLDNELPMLGHAQWKDIELSLSEEGYFSSVKMLFAISPQPICYLGEGPNMAFAKVFDDLYGSWTASQHVPEASLFLSALFDWRAKKPGIREVCILGGDVHRGGVTDIVDLRYLPLKDQRMDRMKQITASAISNHVTKKRQHIAIGVGKAMVNNVGKWHQFSHYNWTNFRNFALIEVSAEGEAQRLSSEAYQSSMAGSLGAQENTVFAVQFFTADGDVKKLSPVTESSHRTFVFSGGWATCGLGTGACGTGSAGGIGMRKESQPIGSPSVMSEASGAYSYGSSYYSGSHSKGPTSHSKVTDSYVSTRHSQSQKSHSRR